jgi:chlorobactene glucosyltransferase
MAPAELCGMIVAALWAVTVAWLIRRAIRQYRAYRPLDPAPPRAGAAMPTLGVVVPARNEADAIPRCLAGLAAQDYPPERLAIVVVDDASSDGTAALAREVAARDPRFRVIEAGPLPLGWTGKSHACWRGAHAVEASWLCFIDADTIPAPPLLRSAVAAAMRRGFDLLSLEPRQELVTPWERLILPAGLCALGFAGALEREAREPLSAAANGQFILLRRAVYERVGGHAAVRAAIAEDSALATRVKARGGRVALLSAASLIAARMYRSLPQLWEGLAKNVTETFGGMRRTAVVVALGFVLPWSSILVPLALALIVAEAPSPSPVLEAALALAALASLAMLCMHIAAARYFAVPAWYGLLFPLGYTLAAVLAVDGLIARRRGRVAWKGRIYQPTRRPPAAQ